MLSNLIASHSDHSPILLSCDPVQNRSSRRRFKFENWWLDKEGLLNVAKESWRVKGNSIVMEKILGCASDLEHWQKWCARKNNALKYIIRAKLEHYRGSSDPASVT